MAQTKIKAGLFEGIIGNGTDGYFLMSNGDGTMTWSSIIINPTIASITYPGSVTAADPAGGETITVTGTGFKTGATVTVGGTSAPAVSYVSETQITFTTPAKAAGDYDIVVTNTDTGSATYINGISYNGIPSWTTAAGSLGTFASNTTISTITLQATEPDAGTITFNITNGALPTGLSLTGANIDGTTSLETADTLYTFTVTATDDESQATPRTFTITVQKQFISTENFTINTYAGTGSTQSIEGKIGTAAEFNGSSSKITSTGLGLTGNPIFSVSFWINPDANSGTPFMFGTNSSGQACLTFVNTSNKLNFGRWGDSLGNTTASIPNNAWTHVAISNNAGAVQVYINGTADLSFSTTYNITGDNLYIGSANTSQYFNGTIDQFRIFNKALSSSEVTTLYGESNTSSTKSTTDIFDDGSGVALYEFEKGAIDTGGTSGYIGSAGIFNGSSSGIVATGFPITGNAARSYGAWVYMTGNVLGAVCGTGLHGTAGQSMTLWIDEAQSRWSMYGFSATYDAEFRTVSTIGNLSEGWHHFGLTWDASSLFKLYINGTLVDTATKSVTYNTPGNFFIGRWPYSPGYWINTKIDQVRVFNKELSLSEVATLAAETSASATKSTTDIFDDGSGVALYELEGNANDTGRGAIDSGQSAVFNGSNSYIDASSLQSLFGGKNTNTVSLWFKTTTTGYESLFGTHAATSINNTIDFNNGNIEVYHRYSNATTSLVTTSGNLNDGNWHNVVSVVNTSTLTASLYIDGLQIGSSVSISSNSWNGTAAMKVLIGNLYYPPNSVYQNYFDGSIDQVRVYNTALSSSDVINLVSENSVPTANLVAHYKLDGNANDETGTYNGTATNVTYSDPAEFPTYNGTATNVSYAYDGTPTNVGFVGTSFQPDLVWIKRRDGTNWHNLTDSVRGNSKTLFSNAQDAEASNTGDGYLSSFNSSGFTISPGSSSINNVGANNSPYVAWSWKAGGTAVSNTDGTITSQVSANQDAGFSIVKINNGSSNTFTFGTGLSQDPELIITKSTTSASGWTTWYSGLSTNQYLYLNTTDQVQTYGSDLWNLSAWDGLGLIGATSSNFNNNLDTILYCFHSVDGYQKVGSYTGKNATNAVTTGFEPRFLMVKLTSAIDGQWVMYDNVRSGNNPRTKKLAANASIVENDSSSLGGDSVHQVNFTSTGFELLETSGGVNTNKLNETYIYLAIA